MTPARATLAASAVAAFAMTLLARTPWGQSHAIASPAAVVSTLAHDLARASLALDLGSTAARALVATVLSLAIGALVGLAFGPPRSPLRSLGPALHFARSIPPALVYPLLLLALGHNERSRVAAAALGSFALVALPVASSIERIDPERLAIARLARLTFAQRAFELYLPEALPALLTAARLAFSQCLVVAVVTEMLAAPQRGLGVVAISALQEYRADRLWLVIALAGALNALFSALVSALERGSFVRAASRRNLSSE